MRKILAIAILLCVAACETAPTYKGNYKERRAQMCAEKPAFCRPACSKVSKTEDGKLQLVCN